MRRNNPALWFFTSFLTTVFALTLIFGSSGCVGGPSTPYPPGVTLPDPMTETAACNAELDKITAGLQGVSLIRQRIPNPCNAYKLGATAAKVGVIWDAYKVNQLVSWTTHVKDTLNAGITYNDFKTILAAQIKGFNKKMGMTCLLFSDLLLEFSDETLISAPDQAILNKGLDKLLVEAQKMALFTSGVPLPPGHTDHLLIPRHIPGA